MAVVVEEPEEMLDPSDPPTEHHAEFERPEDVRVIETPNSPISINGMAGDKSERHSEPQGRCCTASILNSWPFVISTEAMSSSLRIIAAEHLLTCTSPSTENIKCIPLSSIAAQWTCTSP